MQCQFSYYNTLLKMYSINDSRIFIYRYLLQLYSSSPISHSGVPSQTKLLGIQLSYFLERLQWKKYSLLHTDLY